MYHFFLLSKILQGKCRNVWTYDDMFMLPKTNVDMSILVIINTITFLYMELFKHSAGTSSAHSLKCNYVS